MKIRYQKVRNVFRSPLPTMTGFDLVLASPFSSTFLRLG